ncbi:hypothetical protein [Nocardia sp. NPDC058480]|uniref:hypothetical protein n=1 Tax=Nocardia sp. NPDC058480 TaxID=3346522 RepID=UPI003663FFD8
MFRCHRRRELITQDMAAWCKDNIAGLTIERMGLAGHHATEDQSAAIAAAIAPLASVTRGFLRDVTTANG